MAEDVGSLVVKVAMDNSNFQDGIRNLNRSIKKAQSEFKNATAGLKDHGKSLDGLKAKQDMLSKSIDAQSKIVNAYKDKLKESKETLSKNTEAQEKLKTKLENAKKAYEESAKTLGENDTKTKELKVNYEKLSSEYTNNEEKLRNNVRTMDNWNVKSNNAEAKLKNLQGTLKNTSKEIEIQSNKWTILSKKLETAQNNFKKAGDKLESTGKGLTTKVSVPIAGIGVLASKIGMDFEASMSNISALSGTTGEELKKLEKSARDAGATTSKSAKDAADALGYMALAGYDNKQMQEALMPVLRLSEAGNLDLARTSDLVTDSLSALGKSTKDLPVYLDQVAKTAASSNTNIDALMEGLIVCGGTVKNLNVPLDEANTLLGTLANRGIKGSEAGNSFNSILINLTSGAGQAGEAMEKLGLSAFDSNGKFKGVTNVLLELKEKTKNMTEEQRNMYLAMIGGKTQINTLNALLAGVGEEYGELRGKIKDSNGELEKMAKTMQDNNKGSITALKSALEELGIKIYDNLKPSIASLVDFLQKLTNKLNLLSPETQQTIVKLGALAVATGPVTWGLGKISNTASSAIGIISKLTGFLGKTSMGVKGLGTATGVASKGISGLGFAAKAGTALLNPWAIGIGAVTLAGVGLAKHLSKDVIPKVDLFADKVEYSTKKIQKANGEMEDSMTKTTTKISEGTKKAVGAYIELDDKATKSLNNLYINGDKITKDIVKSTVDNYNQMGYQIRQGMDKDYQDRLQMVKKLFEEKEGMSKQEKEQLAKDREESIKSMQAHNVKRKEEIIKAEEEIKNILENASKDNRELKLEEVNRISELQEQLKGKAIDTLSEQEVEAKVIMERIKDYGTRMSAEQASEIIKKAEEQRQKTVEESDKQCEETIKNIIRMRDQTGEITHEQAEKLIENAKRQKKESIDKAEEMKKTVVEKIKEMNKDTLENIDENDGHIKTKWTKLKEWFINNPIMRIIKTVMQKSQQELDGSNGIPSEVDGIAGAYASGTTNAKRGLSLVGENGPELVFMSGGETVLNNKDTMALLNRLNKGVSTDGYDLGKDLGHNFTKGLSDGMKQNKPLLDKSVEALSKSVESFTIELEKAINETVDGKELQKKIKDLSDKSIQEIKEKSNKEIKTLQDSLNNLSREQEKATRGVKKNARYAIKDEYNSKKDSIKKQIELRKEQADKEIKEIQRISKVSTEQIKKELEQRKAFVKQVNDLVKNLVDALKEKYQEQYKKEEETINKEIEKLENWKEESLNRINKVYDEKIRRIEESSKAQIQAIEAEIKAIDEAEKARDRDKQDQEELKKINNLKSSIEFEHNDFNKKELQKELDRVIKDREERLRKQDVEDRKEKLQQQIKDIQESTVKEKEILTKQKEDEIKRINKVYNHEKEMFQKALKSSKEFYDKRTEQARLQAETEKMIMNQNQAEIIELLHSYSKEYEIAGQTLGEKLVDGFKPAIDEIKDMIASITAEINNARNEALGLASYSRSTINNTTNNKNTSYNINMTSRGRSFSDERREVESMARRLAFTT